MPRHSYNAKWTAQTLRTIVVAVTVTATATTIAYLVAVCVRLYGHRVEIIRACDNCGRRQSVTVGAYVSVVRSVGSSQCLHAAVSMVIYLVHSVIGCSA